MHLIKLILYICTTAKVKYLIIPFSFALGGSNRGGFIFYIMSEIKIIDIKIDDLNIDLSDKVYYYAKIKKNKKHFICQMVTDGIINPHLNIKEWSDYVKNHDYGILTN